LRFALAVFLTFSAVCAFAQQTDSTQSSAPQTQNSTPQESSKPAWQQDPARKAAEKRNTELPNAPSTTAANREVPPSKQQPKRILGIMPNYRAVSAGALPPPPTPKESFKLATQNSFDYSAFTFVGITSLLAEASNAHPQLGKGVGGFGQYYWRGFLDKTDGNYWVIFVLPTFLHQDERYYALGKGSILKRGVYAASRVLITPNYQGHNTFNTSEVLGRGISQAISTTYYPAADRTFGAIASKYGYALGRDALSNVFREFWPDIATHVLHRHP